MENADTSFVLATTQNNSSWYLPARILSDLGKERLRQIELYPDDQYLPDLDWLPILAEEFGEVAKAILEKKPGEVRKELIEVAAVAIAWVEAIDGRE